MAWCSDHGLPHSALLAWEPEDRAKLLAHLMESAAKCQMCGTSEWEWGEDRHAYTPQAQTCMGCYLKEVAEADSAERMPGTRITLVPRAVVERQGVSDD